jgi:hypothetical protein
MGDEVMVDEKSSKENQGVVQFTKNVFGDKRKKLETLIKAYISLYFFKVSQLLFSIVKRLSVNRLYE